MNGAEHTHFERAAAEMIHIQRNCSRFIVNLPAEELESIERICFQIEQAHWYYEDFVRPQASRLPSFSLRKFSEIIFKSNPLLRYFPGLYPYCFVVLVLISVVRTL